MEGLPFRRRGGLRKSKGVARSKGEVFSKEAGRFFQEHWRRRVSLTREHEEEGVEVSAMKGGLKKVTREEELIGKRGRWKTEVGGRGRLVVKTKKAHAKQR